MFSTLPRACTSPKTSGHAADTEDRAATAASSCDGLITGVGCCGGGTKAGAGAELESRWAVGRRRLSSRFGSATTEGSGRVLGEMQCQQHGNTGKNGGCRRCTLRCFNHKRVTGEERRDAGDKRRMRTGSEGVVKCRRPRW